MRQKDGGERKAGRRRGRTVGKCRHSPGIRQTWNNDVSVALDTFCSCAD